MWVVIGKRLVETADVLTSSLRGYAMLAMLIGCGLRRGELLALTLESIQQREEHWVIADLVGKGGHVRTVPVPQWVKSAVDAWTTAAAITGGRVFRAINKAGRIWGDGMSPKVLWDVVRLAAAQAGILAEAGISPAGLERPDSGIVPLHQGGETQRRTRPRYRVLRRSASLSGAGRSPASTGTRARGGQDGA
jgi:integrase